MGECASYGENLIDLFPRERGGRIFIAGSSGSGKSELAARLVKKYSCKFYKVIICSATRHHPIANLPELQDKITISKDIIDPEPEVDFLEKNKGLLVVYDDNFLQAANDETVARVFFKGRHLGISAMLISQNLFMQGKYARSISLNCTHFLLLKQRDLGQIETLGRQLFGREKAKNFLNAYKRAIAGKPYGYMLADVSITTPEELSLRSNIANEGPCEIVYSWLEK